MPSATPLLAAVILAGGVTALVAVGMMLVSLHRSARLTVRRTPLSIALGIGVIAIAGVGVAAVSAAPAQAAATTTQNPVTDTGAGTSPDLQLPTE